MKTYLTFLKILAFDQEVWSATEIAVVIALCMLYVIYLAKNDFVLKESKIKANTIHLNLTN